MCKRRKKTIDDLKIKNGSLGEINSCKYIYNEISFMKRFERIISFKAIFFVIDTEISSIFSANWTIFDENVVL